MNFIIYQQKKKEKENKNRKRKKGLSSWNFINYTEHGSLSKNSQPANGKFTTCRRR